MAELRTAANHGGFVAAGLDCEPKAGLPDDAQGQFSLCPEAQVRRDHQFRSWPENLPQLGGNYGVDRYERWMSDITYVRLREKFVFVAVILDAYSRRVIDWALDQTMEDNRKRHLHRHVAQGQSVGQRGLRIVRENPEVPGGAP